MKKIETFEDYRACVDEVKVHDFRYFSLNLPIISDEEYDTMYFALQEYEDAHPDEVLKDSPTQQCYSENGNGKRTLCASSAITYWRRRPSIAGRPAVFVVFLFLTVRFISFDCLKK